MSQRRCHTADQRNERAIHPSVASEAGLSPAPLLTLIVSMYNVERYLGDFLKSVEVQDVDPAHVELLFVDDGSPDNCGQIASDWLRRHTFPGRVIHQRNQGLSAARNRGIEEASGAWISFPDPDDVLDMAYLPIVLERLSTLPPSASALATNVVYLYEDSGERRDTHPLRALFSHGARLIDLSADPQAVKLQAASTFLRRAVILDHGLRFDPRIRPNFEDGAFLMRFHASMPRPQLAVEPAAQYLYRRRADDSSLVASSWTKPEKYIDLPRYGWLETLKAIDDELGDVPRWAQTTVLYDMHWYFRYDGWIHTPTRSAPREVQREFMAICREVLAHIEPETIMGYSLTSVPLHTRLAWLAMTDRFPDINAVHNWRTDEFHDHAQLKYHFTGDRPREDFLLDGKCIEPVHAKDRSVEYFGETVMHERILWLPNAALLHQHLSVRLDDAGVPVLPFEHFAPAWSTIDESASAPLPPLSFPLEKTRPDAFTKFQRRLTKLRRTALSIARGDSPLIRRPLSKVTLFQAGHGKWHRRFLNAWVFMDRDTQAQDNAEHLYRWVRDRHPEVNAWFVLRRSSPDWPRLRSEGVRLVDFGSHHHTLLLKNAEHLISSHVDHYVVHPLSRERYGRENWSYTFLQHGVTKDDISRWLNGKPIELLVASAPAELEGFVSDDTPYTVTTKQVKLTGFPRHDILLDKARATRKRDLILVMPTWREYLMSAIQGKGNERQLIPDFDGSEYIQSWVSFLSDPSLSEHAATHGLDLAFVPHPNLERHVARFHLPEHVRVFTYKSMDIQSVIARARTLVTDYSSLAFDAAYVGTPVVYFQFDREQFFQLHPHRPGYFEYEQDGFGPVTTTPEDAVGAVIQLTKHATAAEKYAKRAELFFPQRDGRNRERTFEAITALRSARNSPTGATL